MPEFGRILAVHGLNFFCIWEEAIIRGKKASAVKNVVGDRWLFSLFLAQQLGINGKLQVSIFLQLLRIFLGSRTFM